MTSKKLRKPERDQNSWSPLVVVVPTAELAQWSRAAEAAGISLRDFVRQRLNA